MDVVTGTNGNFRMDGSPDSGGIGYGARPMEVVLGALAGCTSVDVLTILEKQRQVIRSYRVNAVGERRENPLPRVFTHITLHFELEGTIEEDKARKAIELSFEKYCSVHAMLAPQCVIDYELRILP
jgi:putative redox protein